ncbi:MAG TPA: sigma-70 family RNA polymerase sigma factor [Candidatus Polarisedimenticolia bacterium]|jgi:RNA polymerase sigma-70 factor (ECF subfamily)|nr:sigma-70 family RNA polymerase sigma factor [Candidatus Polarisedimenticolia bacterium]
MNQKALTAPRSEGTFPGAADRRGEFETQALPHLRSLRSVALRLTRNERDAEDLVQDTYLRAFRFFHRFEPGTNIRAWLFRILKNQFLNRVQQAGAEAGDVDLDEILVTGGESAFPHARAKNPEQEVMDAVTASEVEDALTSLPSEYRGVVMLALVDEMSYRDISKALHIPMGTVMSRLHRGRKLLQSQLFDYVAHRHLVSRDTLAAVPPPKPEVSH